MFVTEELARIIRRVYFITRNKQTNNNLSDVHICGHTVVKHRSKLSMRSEYFANE